MHLMTQPMARGRSIEAGIFISIFLLLLGLTGGKAAAADLLREQRIAEQIEEAILVGEPLYLNADGLEFLAIHTESNLSSVRGGAIILHGHGANPNWTDVVQPLRSGLPDGGWETLSLQLPVPAADAPDGAVEALIPEALPRIRAGVAYFQQRDIRNIVLVGHSLGARMGAHYLAANPSREIRAFVAVGMSVPGPSADDKTLVAVQNIKIPVFDIYGSRDIDPVLHTADRRAAAARRGGNREYRQLEVPGADHFFSGMGDELTARVRAWLTRVVGTPVPDTGKALPEPHLR